MYDTSMYDKRQPPFYGRSATISTLQDHLDAVTHSGQGRILAIHGRRQIGKSTAVEQFVRHCEAPYVFTVATQGAGVRTQLEDATLALTESLRPLPGADLTAELSVPGWREWLRITEEAARDHPIVVVLDEFPWAVEADPSLEGTLQNIWDRRLEKLPILLILIGSDVAMMESLNEHGRPLFGRVRPLVIDPLNPAEIAQAIPDSSATDVFDAYLMTGGYPRLVTDLAHGGQSAIHYAHEALRDPYSPLVSTARFTLDAEFPDSRAASRVLASIGADETTTPRFNDLVASDLNATETARIQTATTRALRVLTDEKLLVTMEVPAWASNKGRLRRYRVTDPYLRFWFRYIGRDFEQISRGRSDLVISRLDRDWPSWRGRSIEPVVREALLRLAAHDDRLAAVEQVSAWWTRDGQKEFDVVATSPDHTVLLGTIKWRPDGRVSRREIAALAEARKLVPRSTDARLAAVTPESTNAVDVDLSFNAADLLASWPQ
ncbi:ATP-binding protein [Propionimicrobium sp. PCR01-08-3]|uniref:ATP-binding protein n=1 Tax=Propionimicrobium sp. PCR01-08-3 TaxID=3052086 RepID=UPI00255C2FE5|nr:ATP-binding protein [Propionimicrobium sp. PCR01-08-3]WIY83092.1 ATP-binding protein [Propionimicrobium sp. PCR01-08-3]